MTSQLERANRLADQFVQQAGKARPRLLTEFWLFLRYNKKWWLTPIVLLLFVIGLVTVLGGSAAAPFIYTLF